MMIGGSVLHHLLKPSNPTQDLAQGHRQQQQECFPLLHQCKSIEDFKQIHAQSIKLSRKHEASHGSHLLAACALSDWGDMDYARSIFHQIEYPTPFEFNTLLRGYTKEGNPEPAISLYKAMQERGAKPDNFTFPPVLKACGQLSVLGVGMQVLGHVHKLGLQSDIFVLNSLISMYGKCGEIKLCCSVFEQMGVLRTVASWSALLAAHTRAGLWGECLSLFGTMNAECQRPDESTLVSVLTSCAHLGALDLGRSAHCSLLRNMSELNFIVQTSLVDMYIKCGCLEQGLCIFKNMEKKTLQTYTVVISGLAMHANGEKALWVFSHMLAERLQPDEVVYVSLLMACSRAGLIAEGLRCFDRMRFEHRIEPTLQHYACVVDLLGRAGKLEEAYELVQSMPIEPNDIVWRCLLSACRIHNNLEIGEVASRNLLRLDPQHTGDYVLLSNMYAQAHRWGDVARLRTDLVNGGLSQVPGYSRVEVKRELHTFFSQDRSHPRTHEVYKMLYQMEWQLRYEGYSADTSQVLLDVDEEEKRQMIGGHCQKLAIAFALVSTNQGSPIRIVRNLRMCNDCHEYTRLISKIFAREVIVRERNQFHHFREGACCCGGYW